MSTGSSDTKGGVFALGNFDGVHRGHQAVIAAAVAEAQKLGAPARVLTFEPHPRTFLAPPHAPFRLTPPAAKMRLLKDLGIADVVVQDFTPELSRLAAKDFVEQVLVKKYAAQHIVAGANFVFGHGRSGTMQAMQDWLAPHGVGATVVPSFCDDKGEPLSSSRLRTALQKGDLEAVRVHLGRPFVIGGKIVSGAKRGKTIGFPTANIEMGEYLRPKFGVYAVTARREGSAARLPGIVNIGTRPTVGGVTELLELHLFDFNGDLYGQDWEVELRQFIRPEQTFPSLEALREQILLDIEKAKAIPA